MKICQFCPSSKCNEFLCKIMVANNSIASRYLKSFAANFGSMVRAFFMPRFGANVLGLNINYRNNVLFALCFWENKVQTINKNSYHIVTVQK